jgi:predicted PurR-regulated permease PerM
MLEQRRLPFLVFVAIAAGLVGVVLYPLWKPLFLGGVFATALSRVHERLTLWVRGRRGLAATLLTITAILVLLGPVASVAVVAARQAVESIIALRQLLAADDLNGLLLRVPHPLSDLIARLRDLVLPVDATDLAGELPGKLLQGSRWAAGLAGGALRLTSELAFELGIMLVTMHVLLVDGRRLVTWMIEVSPLPRSDTQALLIEFKKATRAILTSTLATAAVQGLIAGAPRPLFFGLVTFLCAFIPGVGTALVAVPMACWLFFTGHHAGAVFLVVYFLLVVSMVDNLMKPMLMKAGMRMHGAVVFLSLIGGVLSFGPIGLVAGPLALTFFLAMIRLREPVA